MEKLAQFLNESHPKRLLDIGTGGGNFIRRIMDLYDFYEEVIGIDTSERAIQSANKQFEDIENIHFMLMDGNKTTFPDEEFDLVTLSNSLHHLDDMKQTLTEMERVLKKDGYLLFSEMISNDLTKQQKSHLLLHHFAAKLDRLKGQTHNDTFTEKEIEELLTTHSNLIIEKSWVLYYERTENNSDEEINWLLDTVDRLIKGIDDQEIMNEAQDIKEYIKKNGFDSCPAKIVVMKK